MQVTQELRERQYEKKEHLDFERQRRLRVKDARLKSWVSAPCVRAWLQQEHGDLELRHRWQ